MPTSPVIEWRDPVTPANVLSTLPLSGQGYAGSIPVGTSSSVATVRIYNNYVAASGVVDAYNCVLAVYDDAIHQGTAVTPPTTGLYLQVQVVDYNGVTTGGDTSFFALGGQTKHPIPVNGAVLSGTGANYLTVNVQAVVPSTATQGSITQGVWLEYSASV